MTSTMPEPPGNGDDERQEQPGQQPPQEDEDREQPQEGDQDPGQRERDR